VQNEREVFVMSDRVTSSVMHLFWLRLLCQTLLLTSGQWSMTILVMWF